MAAPSTYTKTGNKAATAAKLDASVFGIKPENHELLKTAYVTYLANGRDNLAVTKTRGLIRGGGRKPWRQKGTGRARFGSSRNPIWRGGGIVFGPTGQENYSKQLNLKAKRQALRQALSLKAENVKIIEALECKDGRTKQASALLDKIGAAGNILLVVGAKDEMLQRATRNLPSVKVLTARYLNVFDILNADSIVISHDSLAVINEWLGDKK